MIQRFGDQSPHPKIGRLAITRPRIVLHHGKIHVFGVASLSSHWESDGFHYHPLNKHHKPQISLCLCLYPRRRLLLSIENPQLLTQHVPKIVTFRISTSHAARVLQEFGQGLDAGACVFHALVRFDGMVALSYGAQLLGHCRFVKRLRRAWDLGFRLDKLVELAANGGSLSLPGFVDVVTLDTFAVPNATVTRSHMLRICMGPSHFE